MSQYRFDLRAFLKTFLTSVLFCGVAATLFAIFWEDKPSQELAVKTSQDKIHVYTMLVGRDALIGLGIGAVLGIVLGIVGSTSKKRATSGIWGER